MLPDRDIGCCAGLRHPDRRHLSNGIADVPGGIFGDRMRLRLLQTLKRALERSFMYEYRCLEIPKGSAGHFAQIIPPSKGITPFVFS